MVLQGTKILEKTVAHACPLISLVQCYYRKVVTQEVELARLSKEDHILCIGGGALPCTALEMARLTGARIDVVDSDPQAVNLAQGVLDRLGYSHLITAAHALGEELGDLSKYTAVHIALQVTPKEKVFGHIWQRISAGTRVLVRVPKDFLKGQYSQLAQDLALPMGQSQSRLSTMKGTILFAKTS